MKTKLEALPAIFGRYLLYSALLATALVATPLHAARSSASISGEIQFLTINNPADAWSGGTMVIAGQIINLPRNLLMDLPANRLTLKQLVDQAPAACAALNQTGLAKGDTCNLTGAGGYAAISANRTATGNVIAADVLIQKSAGLFFGVETTNGEVTYIDYNDGYFRLNGDPANLATTGVMVRLNDPTSRHTVQQGLGCAAGNTVNCSADPRFTLDPDNYTNVFGSGYPICIPSTVPRTVTIGLPAVIGIPGLAVDTVARANADGTGDALCPTTNRTVNGGQPVDDSRRFAPIMLGDNITAEGNFERVNGVQFMSAHSTMIGNNALATKNDPSQPDYIFIDELGIDAAGFENQRIRSLFIGFATKAPNDVVIWSIHRDPTTGAAHEFPLATVVGCDIATGGGCGGQGLVGAGNRIWKIRHDVDFGLPTDAKLDPCVHLRNDLRFSALNICPGSATSAGANLNEQFSILSPMPREVQARTGHKLANPDMVTLDVNGKPAANGQYLFPLGANLGGVSFPEMVEIDLNTLNKSTSFTGIPWMLDRRLSPGGCNAPCEATPQPLDPFPWEGYDPRTQASVPTAALTDRNFTATTLTDTRNRILSYVTVAGGLQRTGNGFESPAAGNFNGNATVLALPTVDSAFIPFGETPLVNLNATQAPVAVADTSTVVQGASVSIPVLGNDSDPDGGTLSVTGVTAVTPLAAGTVTNNGGDVTFVASANFSGVATFTYTISDGQGGTATAPVSVTVSLGPNQPPVANADSATTAFNTAVTIAVLANDTDPNGNALSLVSVTNGTAGTVTTNGTTVTFTPTAGFSGPATFTYTVSDGSAQATGNVTVTVGSAATVTVTLSDFIVNGSEWRLAGTDSTIGATITVTLNRTGAQIGTAAVSAARTWTMRVRNSPNVAVAGDTVSISSTDGATRQATVRLR